MSCFFFPLMINVFDPLTFYNKHWVYTCSLGSKAAILFHVAHFYVKAWPLPWLFKTTFRNKVWNVLQLPALRGRWVHREHRQYSSSFVYDILYWFSCHHIFAVSLGGTLRCCTLKLVWKKSNQCNELTCSGSPHPAHPFHSASPI